MAKGTVKFYDAKKEFGFIIDGESKKDVYFNKSGLITSVEDDDRVEYTETQTKRGVKAINVKKLR